MKVDYMTVDFIPEKREKLVTTFGEADTRDLELAINDMGHVNAVYGFYQGVVCTLLTGTVVAAVALTLNGLKHIKTTKKDKAKM